MNERDYNPVFTLRYTTEAGPVSKALTSPEIHLFDGPAVNALGDAGSVWDIAVLDGAGRDVTGRFPCFT